MLDNNVYDLDSLSTLEIARRINYQDKKVALAIESELDSISSAVDIITKALKNGGRLIYIGSGTSGKMGVIDASECPPTFGVEDDLVQGIISGGKDALSGWLEHTEDDEELGISNLKDVKLCKKDVVVGISASGNTPYVKSALQYGKSIGAKTIGLMCSKNGIIKDICDLTISIDVGPEIIMGSTRMKAGTAQKMVLNMLSTTAMIKLGKTYLNLMVNVKPINKKLQKRVVKIVQLAAEVTEEKAINALEKCEYDPKVAIVLLKAKTSVYIAKDALNKCDESIYNALNMIIQ